MASTSDRFAAVRGLPDLVAEQSVRRLPERVFQGKDAGSLFMRSALALLDTADLAAAICGDKSAIPDEAAYYEAFYAFARRQPHLSVVRIFGPWIERGNMRKAEAHLRNHDAAANVMGLWAKESSGKLGALMGAASGLGLVLVKSSQVLTALLHWGQEDGFAWTATADPLVTTALLDAWGELLPVPTYPRAADELDAFRRRIGAVRPSERQ